MPIRALSLLKDSNIIQIIPSSGTTVAYTEAQYNAWRAVNPTATEEDLQGLLETVAVISGRQVHIHVYDLQGPDLAVLVAYPTDTISDDWWQRSV